MKKRIQSNVAVLGDSDPLVIPAALVAPLIRVLKTADETAPGSSAPEAPQQDHRRAFARRRARDERLLRSARADYFPPVLFAEPGWEILLLLFVQPDGADALTTTEVSERAGINLNTAIRWIDYLEVSNLVVRRRHEKDRRATVLTLTTVAEDRLINYFCLPRLCAETAAPAL